ncbi:hypothetical protein [Streptomyces silvisoli]|uniref:Transcriptional regulator n=1 Tax=Streptomyces silvisoli TaxID=3034235 RepID=A0ABT5ZRI0_9ACTN|nr:hypothetical protein [Streptomyces silvisoli]MDF3292437.1 hypothetical protein [Streptomyces silvisoli]
MTTPEILHHPHARRTITALSSAGLIRLISEIDDNGPVSRGSLGGTFDDLARHQLRRALEAARDVGVVCADEEAQPARYRLTRSGEDLAEVYDTVARWARTHQYPSHSGDFVTRVQSTLQLLARVPDTHEDPGDDGAKGRLEALSAVLGPNAARALDVPRVALAAWFQEHPHALRQTQTRSHHAADETEHAA